MAMKQQMWAKHFLNVQEKLNHLSLKGDQQNVNALSFVSLFCRVVDGTATCCRKWIRCKGEILYILLLSLMFVV